MNINKSRKPKPALEADPSEGKQKKNVVKELLFRVRVMPVLFIFLARVVRRQYNHEEANYLIAFAVHAKLKFKFKPID